MSLEFAASYSRNGVGIRGARGARERLAASRGRGTALTLCAVTALAFFLPILGIEIPLAAALLVACLATVGAFLSVQVGLGLLLALVVLFQRTELFTLSIPLMGGGLKPTDVLLIAILTGWIVRRSSGRTLSGPSFRPMSLFLLGFVAWAGVCAALGVARGAFYKESLLELRPLLQFLLIFPITSELGRADVRRLLYVVLGCVALLSLKALTLYALDIGTPALYAGGELRVMTVEFAYLVIGSLLCLGFMSGDEGATRPWLGALWWVSMAALTVTFYRTAVFGLLAGVSVLLLLSSRSARRVVGRFLAVGGTAAGVAAAALITTVPRARDFADAVYDRVASVAHFGEDVSAQHRLGEWRAAIEAIAAHPIEGNGLGTHVEFYSPEYNQRTTRMGFWSSNVYMHNNYLWLLMKTGAIGFALFASLVGSALIPAVRALRDRPPVSDAGVLVTMLACFAALIVMAVFGPMLTTDLLTPFVVLGLGTVAVLTAPYRWHAARRVRNRHQRDSAVTRRVSRLFLRR